MKKFIVLLSLSLMVTSYSCQEETPIENGNNIIELDEKSAQLVDADNTFGLELFQQVREASDKENIMVSPLSISVALAMAYNGADGTTRVEMEEMLYLNGLSVETINSSYKLLIQALQSLDDDVVFELANAIYYQDGFMVKSPFLTSNKEYYDAEIESLEFGSPSTIDYINSWVAEKTHDKILKILDSLSPDDRMVLLNAIYFNGIWSKKFDDNGTKLRNFKKADGTIIEIPMMNKEDKLEYTSNDLFEAIKLPYGKGQYNMMVMLPADDRNSRDIIHSLSAENLNDWMITLKEEEQVVVTMPRFKFAFEQNLNDVLKNLGMLKAFQPMVADFSKISDQHLYISSIKHKSYIDVNENGTEAAAVTAITFTTTSIGPDENQKIYFTVDKPFVFAITEKDTGAILFIGEVQNPEYEDEN